MPEALSGCLTQTSDIAAGYRDTRQQHLPHVVRFSGGRSSALMTLQLAEAGLLQPDRGDVVLFANTTAEHPGTYEFARRICDRIETEFGVPCLWYEGCAVESATRTGYTRKRTYKLVKRVEATDNDNPAVPGYRSHGEAFEAMVSWSRLPSRWRRMCTTELKVKPGHDLVAEWISNSPGPAHQGHHRNKSLASPTVVSRRYQGSLTKTDRKQRLQAACGEPWNRLAQNFQDFTTVDLNRDPTLPRRRADIWGRYGTPQQFVSLLGLRADEPERVKTVMWRSLLAEGAAGSQCRDTIQPAGEMVYCPLSDAGITKTEVTAFWATQKDDLDIPDGAGNCVYCFLKGPAALSRLAGEINLNGGADTPVDIRWWSDLEKSYGRPSTTKDGDIGMFHDTDYRTIADHANGQRPEANLDSEAMVPCSCTD